MQETWHTTGQNILKVCPFVVASQKDVARFTRRAKTRSHWWRQRQLKRDSVFHLLDEMNQNSKNQGKNV
jgi:hypothetical protein